MPGKRQKNNLLLSASNENSLLKLAEPEILKLDQERVSHILSLAQPGQNLKIGSKLGKNMLLTAPIKPLSLRGSDPLRLKTRKAQPKEY